MTDLPALLRSLLRPLLLAAAALGLLGSGGVELAPRLTGPPLASAPAVGLPLVSRTDAPRTDPTRTDSPHPRAVVRAGLAIGLGGGAKKAAAPVTRPATRR